MTNQTPRDLCRCGGLATIRIDRYPLCRSCCERIRIQACKQLNRRHKAKQIGTVFDDAYRA